LTFEGFSLLGLAESIHVGLLSFFSAYLYKLADCIHTYIKTPKHQEGKNIRRCGNSSLSGNGTLIQAKGVYLRREAPRISNPHLNILCGERVSNALGLVLRPRKTGKCFLKACMWPTINCALGGKGANFFGAPAASANCVVVTRRSAKRIKNVHIFICKGRRTLFI
jgi:hypothetical protein